MSFQEKIKQINTVIEGYRNVKVIAATKYLTVEQTRELVEAGQKLLGENRTDMFLEKYEALKDLNIEWHFFGVLQSRKIKDVVNKISFLHSLEKLSIAMELDKKLEKPLNCFVQVNISEEINKQGIPSTKVKSFIKSLGKCKNIKIIGLMCIAKLTFDEDLLRKYFLKMQKLQQEVIEMDLDYAPCTELSMGMSNDYKIALEYGATYLRIGRMFMS